MDPGSCSPPSSLYSDCSSTPEACLEHKFRVLFCPLRLRLRTLTSPSVQWSNGLHLKNSVPYAVGTQHWLSCWVTVLRTKCGDLNFNLRLLLTCLGP